MVHVADSERGTHLFTMILILSHVPIHDFILLHSIQRRRDTLRIASRLYAFNMVIKSYLTNTIRFVSRLRSRFLLCFRRFLLLIQTYWNGIFNSYRSICLLVSKYKLCIFCVLEVRSYSFQFWNFEPKK